MKLIINADDFGHCDDTVQETISCFESGCLTSATLMVTMPAAKQALQYAINHPEFSFGIHLTFVRDSVESPVSSPADIKTLVDENGCFKDSQTLRKEALTGKLDRTEIEAEVVAQVRKAQEFGLKVSHVDSHGHLHKFPVFVHALENALPSLGITKVRTVQDIYLKTPWRSPNFWLGRRFKRLIDSRFKSTDKLYLPTSTFDNSWPNAFLDRFSGLEGVVEIGVHPGRSEPWRQAESIQVRHFARLARERNHQLLTWNDL